MNQHLASVEQQKSLAAWISVASNILLVLGKTGVGIFMGSVSVISEAIHSAIDLLAALIALFAVKTSSRPSDDDHPYGHGKFENISGTIEALLIFVAAIWILYEAIHKLTHPTPLDAAPLGILVMLVSAIINWLVSGMLFRVGKRTQSIALEADGWHLRADVYTSLGVMAGLGLIQILSWLQPHRNFSWIDPVCAIVIALMIMKTAYDLTIKAGRDLLDTRLPQDELDWIKNRIRSISPEIRGFHRLRTRRSGNQRFIDFHLLFEKSMTIEQVHSLSDLATSAIKERFVGASVIVHSEPCDESCSPHCLDGCFFVKK